MSFFKQESNYQVAEVKRLQEYFQSGRLSRREFAQGLFATGLTAATATMLLTTTRDVQAETPKHGGHVKVAWDQHGPSDTLDPRLLTATIDYTRSRVHLNSLLQFNDDMTLRPDLAASFEVNASATEFTFNLEKGVTFHDGKDLTAADVVYSMNLHLGEDSVSKAKKMVDMITEWKALDKHTVRATLGSPNADLPAILATFHFKVVPEGTEDFTNVVGTGPFILEEFSPGVRTLSKKNPNYYRDGHPYADSLEIFAITDSVARANALVSGDIHLMGNLDPKGIKQIEDDPNLEVFSVESGAEAEIVCMLDRTPGNNHDFVMALKLLQNRPRLVGSVFKNHAVVGNDHPIGPSYAMHCESLAQREQDLDKAKFHFKKSGITEAEIVTADSGPGMIDMTLLTQAEARKIGMDIKVKRVASDGYWGTVWLNTPICAAWWNMRPTANMMLSLQFHSEAPWNDSKFKNARVDQILLESRAETDIDKRKEMFCEAEELISNLAGNVIPVHRNYVDAKMKIVKGMRRVPLSAFGGAEFPEYIWLDV